jgi:Cytochrome c
MYTFRHFAVVAGLTALAVLARDACSLHGESPASGAPAIEVRNHATPAGWTFTWPKGDPAKGRDVFVKLECYSCHEVVGQSFPGPSVPEKVGPELSAMASLHEPAYFAEAIINPNATVEKGKGYEAGDGSSKMPSYNDAVTVQEVIDLVAFLRLLKPPTTPVGSGGHERHH